MLSLVPTKTKGTIPCKRGVGQKRRWSDTSLVHWTLNQSPFLPHWPRLLLLLLPPPLRASCRFQAQFEPAPHRTCQPPPGSVYRSCQSPSLWEQKCSSALLRCDYLANAQLNSSHHIDYVSCVSCVIFSPTKFRGTLMTSSENSRKLLAIRTASWSLDKQAQSKHTVLCRFIFFPDNQVMYTWSLNVTALLIHSSKSGDKTDKQCRH